MRQAIIYGLMAFAPFLTAQKIEEISGDDILPESEIDDDALISGSSAVSDFTQLAATDDSLEPHGVRIDLTWSRSRRATADESGYFITPLTGKGLRAFPEYLLNTVKIAKGGECSIVYTNTSETEPPLPDGVEPWEKTDRMTFGPEGGEIEFRGRDSPDGAEYSRIQLQYVYCGAEDKSTEKISTPGRTCPEAVHGDLSTDILTICCSGVPFWKADIWDANEMSDYLRNALEGFNKNGWPSSIMNTFATHNLESFKPAHELQGQPFWEWQCASMHDECSVDDLSEQTACVIDPKRATVLRALENLANMWVSSRTKFTEDGLTEIIMTLPGITKSLFPVGDPKFDAPGDYEESSWVMIAGGILGAIVAPLPLVASAAVATPVGVAAALISGIMWLIGLSLGPLNIAGAEEDPHFTNFGSFSEGEARDWVKSTYGAYESVFNYFFVNKPEGTVDVDHVMALFEKGGLIPRDPADQTRNIASFSDYRDDMENTFLAPLVNLAWQRQKVFAVKIPKGGIEFWRHRRNNLLNPHGEDRTSVTYDPCGGHEGGDIGWRRQYRTSVREVPKIWSSLGSVVRSTCYSDGTGHAFLAWDGAWDRAWADYGFEEMDKRGLKMPRVIEKAQLNQNTFGFNGGVSDTWEEKIKDMSDSMGSFMNDPSALEFFNIPVCDLTKAHDTYSGIIRVEGCDMKHRGGFNGADEHLDEFVCINRGIREWCKENQKDPNNNAWPFE